MERIIDTDSARSESSPVPEVPLNDPNRWPDRIGYDDLHEAAREAVDRHHKHIGEILARRGILDVSIVEIVA